MLMQLSLQIHHKLVLCNDRGFIAARSLTVAGCIGVDVGEAMGFLEALSWVKELGLSNVLLEGDSKTVVGVIASSIPSLSSFGDYIVSCKSLIEDISNITVVFVRRDANTWAHVIARAARLYNSPLNWVDPPATVIGLSRGSCS
ncbi:hypothetical protein ACS0TY_007742 [Phlomoides rotata]